ncbi:MAG: recombinase RecF [Planctomycetes bacterium RBG_16_64_10]|nr:MAG: recombinase RecF [Planctomycetes bacterium RBG_16_64_10]
MLNRIHIRGYKSLLDVEVELRPLTVLFGPNAAGKSNFLDALQLLSHTATSRTLKEAFEPPYRGKPLESFSFGERGLKQLLEQESARFSIEVDVELAPAVVAGVNAQIREMRKGKTPEDGTAKKPAVHVRERNLRYRIEIEILPKSGILRVSDEYLAALTTKGTTTKSRRPFVERVGNRIHLRMEGQAHPIYHDRYLDHSILSLPVYPPHYPHLVAMRQELSRYFFFYFEPRERMRAPNPVKEVRHIGFMGEELAAFLNTLRTLDPRQFRAVEKSLHMIVPSVTGIHVDVNAMGEVDLLLREGELEVPARVVSEGTLRVLGLLALSGAKDPPALVGFEEPENGVHPGRVRMIADLLRTRAATGESQLIVTTHSPILPDLIPDDSLFVCRKDTRQTAISPFRTWGPLGRRKDIDEALDESLTPSQRIMRGDFDA